MTRNFAHIVLLILTITCLNGMEEKLIKQANVVHEIKPGDTKAKELTLEEIHDIEQLKTTVEECEHHLNYVLLKKVQALEDTINREETLDEKLTEFLLIEIFSIGDSYRTVRDHLTLAQNNFYYLPNFTEKNLLLDKLPLLHDQSYKYSHRLKELLSIILSKITQKVRHTLLDKILYFESLSFADEIEHAIYKNNIATVRLKFQGWRNEDIVIFERDLFKGANQEALVQRKPPIPLNTTAQELNKILGKNEVQRLVGDYKIHLMPRDIDLEQIVLKLLNCIKKNPNLQEVIGGVKIKALTEQFVEFSIDKIKNQPFPIRLGQHLPKIVIYVGNGKEKAQRALDLIYAFFKDCKGLDRAAAFNERVTNCIYFAQGNRDDKLKYPQFFEDDLVYYKSDITGSHQNYRLVNPASKK